MNGPSAAGVAGSPGSPEGLGSGVGVQEMLQLKKLSSSLLFAKFVSSFLPSSAHHSLSLTSTVSSHSEDCYLMKYSAAPIREEVPPFRRLHIVAAMGGLWRRYRGRGQMQERAISTVLFMCLTCREEELSGVRWSC